MDVEDNNNGEYFKYRAVFRNNAYKLIEEMVFLSEETEEDTTPLVDEILHSIFFLGRIYNPKFSPESIVKDDEMRDFLEESYPHAFRLYSSQLPLRAPFSCLLDMIVHKFGQGNEQEIKNQLQRLVELIGGATTKILLSSTMCVSQVAGPDFDRYYGVSLSTYGKAAGKIMVAASCLRTWHEHVAGAVLSYDLCKIPRAYFNGVIRLPENVRCEAFNITDQIVKLPCASCKTLFGFQTHEKTDWPYGNCAEVESLSKLLINKAEVTRRVRFQTKWTNDGRQMAETELRKELDQLLKTKRYKWDGKFYCPQGAQTF